MTVVREETGSDAGGAGRQDQPRMRVAFVVSTYPSSGDTFITNQITGLLDRGHDLQIFALSQQQGLTRLHEDVVAYKLPSRTHYHGKPEPRSNELKVLLGDFLREPIRAFRRLMSSRMVKRVDESAPIFDGYFKIRTYEREEPYDIFNIHYGPVANNMLFLREMFPQSKYVANFHGYDFSSRIRYHGLNYYDLLWKNADLITTQSFFSRDCLIAIGCPPEKVIKHPVGIDVGRFTYRPRRLEQPGDEVHFAIVSRLTEKKAHRLILDAFAKLAVKRPNVFLHIVGGGELKEEIEGRIAADSTLRKHVTMHGFMTQGEVADLLGNCHIFIHPSVTTMRWAEQEDTTTVLMEAQAMGLPVISTYHAGIPEVVKPGKSGLLVPERNEDALLEAMLTLVDEPERWEPMGREGRSLVEEKFDIAMLNARLEWVFQKLRGLPRGSSLGIRSTEDLREIR